MNDVELLKNKKLIAKFMGLTIITDGISWFDTSYKGLKKYNESWDYLMPVLEKIEENYYTEILGTNTKNDNSYIMNIFDYNGKFIFDPHSHKSKLELVFITIVDFIKWHNKNKVNETN